MKLKFRAWDGERLRNVNTIGWVDDGVDFVTTPRYSGPAEDFILMQYTGLKDKNGVEIYDGDIVKYIHIDYIDQNTSVYRYFIVECESAAEGMYPFNNEYFSVYGDDYEIIGNIYENPEMMEVTE